MWWGHGFKMDEDGWAGAAGLLNHDVWLTRTPIAVTLESRSRGTELRIVEYDPVLYDVVGDPRLCSLFVMALAIIALC